MVASPSRRIPGIDSRPLDIPGDHSPGTDHDVIANIHRQDAGVAADADAIANPGGPPPGSIATGGTAGREIVVDKNHAMADETLGADFDHVADETMGLDLCIVSDHGAPLNLHERTDETIVAYSATVKIDWHHDADTDAKVDIDDPPVGDLDVIRYPLPLRHGFFLSAFGLLSGQAHYAYPSGEINIRADR